MTVKLVVLSTQPDDPAAFDDHYLLVHGGEATFHRMAELYLADPDAMGRRDVLAGGPGHQRGLPADRATGSRIFLAAVD